MEETKPINPVDQSELETDIIENEKVVPDLYQAIVAEEELQQKDVSIKETLVTLVDSYLQQRGENLTLEQRQQLASFRGKIIISLTAF